MVARPAAIRSRRRVGMQIAAESPFGQEVPVLVPHQHLDPKPRMAVLLGKFDGRTQGLPLAGIGAGITPSGPHDFPFGLAPHDDVSKMIHRAAPSLANQGARGNRERLSKT
jgi:hypothetical protein